MTTNTPAPGPNRRGFLDVLLGTSLVASLGSVLYPVIRYLKPLPQAGPGGPTRLTGEELAKLERDHFLIVPVGGKRVLVLQGANRELLAFDAKCTHEGCTVQYMPGQSVIWCACHNARFDLNGRVLSGPPPRPLPKYAVERHDNGEIVVMAETEGA